MVALLELEFLFVGLEGGRKGFEGERKGLEGEMWG